MISRRGFGMTLGGLALASASGFEAAFAQRAMVATAPPGTVWINANEFPDGPCSASQMAMSGMLANCGRYHYQEFPAFYANVAKSEGLDPSQVLVGAGSSEVLHTCMEAFTSATRPLIAPDPTFEFPGELAKAAGHPLIKIPLTSDYSADVKKIAAAAKPNGGLIYMCNPNNPTASITSKQDIAWLVENLPANTVLMMDEAYIHFTDSPKTESAMRYVKAGKNVVVTRTFSKIYGMAGLRVGFGAAKPELIAQMAPYRNNVVSCVSSKAVEAALADEALVPQRRKQLAATRSQLCDWLTSKKLPFIEPHANFMMIDIGRPARPFIPKMLERGVAIGRPFPPYDHMIRVTIGTNDEMATFRRAFWAQMQAA